MNRINWGLFGIGASVGIVFLVVFYYLAVFLDVDFYELVAIAAFINVFINKFTKKNSE